MITESDYMSPIKIRHFKMIEEYNMLMSMPNATQKVVLNSLQKRYHEYYKSFDSMKQTFAKLKRQHPEKFKN